MKKTNFTVRAFVQKTGQVMVRVRWCGKMYEVGFSVGYTIDLSFASDFSLSGGNRELVKGQFHCSDLFVV